MSEPRAFPGAASGALAPVATKVGKVKEQALAGSLTIDLEVAKVILVQLGTLRARAAELVRDCVDLDTPLRFGDNWVGRIMSERLRMVAVDSDGGVTHVLTAFHQVLDDLEATVRFAAGMYETSDESAADDLRRAVGQFGVTVEEES
ncbi:hypothetical protein [Actinophytocola algeriensis]|uniref:Excreted virulence factor EspC (Type VII ESX diderm) n=1 Tax=Actinophytocola algeriensis TaxID=1768010 RepID=A0A7W7Q522_9PSEU|nr:hypothetical protein [Actinophytocola algeriensis]MBB4906953.1 hypothetical protein [Actinophytocola algeriensis]MBE1478435.1 hypothetical protein [Actinophytocola algeriensis]